MKKIYKEDHGKTLDLKIGDTLRIVLEGNATTGYQWHITEQEEEVISLMNNDYDASASDRIGAGGMVTFDFQIKKPGSHDIHLQYYRVWEGKENAIDEFRITLKVKEND